MNGGEGAGCVNAVRGYTREVTRSCGDGCKDSGFDLVDSTHPILSEENCGFEVQAVGDGL